MFLIRKGEEPEEISAERWDAIALHVRQRAFLAVPKRAKVQPKKRKRYQVSESTRSQRAFLKKAAKMPIAPAKTTATIMKSMSLSAM